MNEKKIILHEPICSIDGDVVNFSADYTVDGKSHTLWYQFDRLYEAYLNKSSSNAFFLPALILAMHRNYTLVVEGKVSSRMISSASKKLQTVFGIINPSFSTVDIIANRLYKYNDSVGRGAATGFSCGVDSISAVQENYFNQLDDSLKLTHLLQINHSQKSSGGETVWSNKLNLYWRAAQSIGLPLVTIKTNLYARMPVKYQSVHTLLNCSAAMLFDGLYNTYFYASGYSYQDLGVRVSKDIAISDPIILPLISSETLTFTPEGSQFSRVEKTKKIMDLDLSINYLDVCTKSPKSRINCSLCYKCLRTMMTLDALGSLNKYKDIFDLARWKRKRSGYVDLVMKSTEGGIMGEIRNLGESTGYFKKILRYRQKYNTDSLAGHNSLN